MAAQASSAAAPLASHCRTDSAAVHLRAPCAAAARLLPRGARAASTALRYKQPGAYHFLVVPAGRLCRRARLCHNTCSERCRDRSVRLIYLGIF